MVGGFNHLEKFESQWEGLSHILSKMKMFETTNQVIYISSIHLIMGFYPTKSPANSTSNPITQVVLYSCSVADASSKLKIIFYLYQIVHSQHYVTERSHKIHWLAYTIHAPFKMDLRQCWALISVGPPQTIWVYSITRHFLGHQVWGTQDDQLK